jgi:serine/threonine protein kinase
VLYSFQDHLWKLADFGLSAEGTSKRPLTTVNASGTSGYRAPELVRELTYTNKVDIWAMGCILFELIFARKAFPNDIDVWSYACSGKELNIPLKESPVVTEDTILGVIKHLIHAMLGLDAVIRPAANCLTRIFNSAWDFKWGQAPSQSKSTGSRGCTINEIKSLLNGTMDPPSHSMYCILKFH